MKKIVYIDLDDTLADFYKAASDHNGFDETHMYDKYFFLNLKPIPGALKNVRRLIKAGFDIWILTQPLAESHYSYSEKARWVCQYLPELSNKIIMTQHKGLHIGDYLIDDNLVKWKEKFEKNGGKFVHFQYDRLGGHSSYYERLWEELASDLINGRV